MNVLIVMGSKSDQEVVRPAFDILNDFGVKTTVRVLSAHRSLDLVLDAVKTDVDVIIAFAGKAAHLAGVIAGATIKPVIGVPVQSSDLGGLDALLSTVQMPKGVPVASMAINGSQNAAYFALQILALNNKDLENKLIQFKKDLREDVVAMDTSLGW